MVPSARSPTGAGILDAAQAKSPSERPGQAGTGPGSSEIGTQARDPRPATAQAQPQRGTTVRVVVERSAEVAQTPAFSTAAMPFRCTSEPARLAHNPRIGNNPRPTVSEPIQPDLPPGHRSGFVAICGRPNVGKSTLLNALLGEPVAVATDRPQTTRERLVGVWTRPHFQAVLVDTPGIHRARSALNKYMVDEAVRGARDVDVVLLLAETPRVPDAETAQQWQPGEMARESLRLMAELGHPIVLVLTKTDRLEDPRWLLPILETWAKEHEFAAIVPTSAVAGEGLDALEQEVVGRLPEGPRYYDPEQLSDRSLRWHAAELVRAELFRQLGEELPYSCAVVVNEYREHPQRDAIVATIFVERHSQRGIVIGRGGRQLKAIGTAARAAISRLTGRACDLRLTVSVAHNWTKNPEKLENLGYRDPEGS